MNNKSSRFYDYFSRFFSELKIYYYLFKKENVFQYLLIIFVLMVIAGFLFMAIEYPRLLMALPDKNSGWFDKIVTVMYWAIVTIATCGYGDITPISSAGRIMAIVVLFLSIGSVSLFTANLASALTTKKMMERRGIMNLKESRDHYVICGWKNSMDSILAEIMVNNPKLSMKRIIIIANIEPDTIELFNQQYPQYQDVTILRGEHYKERLLKKANVQKAAKVLVLADESAPATATETDSKTVMTAMTLHSISPNIKVCAELLDMQFEKYLRTTFVEEIIYPNEYNKILIANAVEKTGIAKVFNHLLSSQTSASISTSCFPETYIGKKFSELRDFYKKTPESTLIGLLENVGTLVERKKEALREAQKTADVTKLIENLQTVKRMENNLPNIIPDEDYSVPQNSMAILITRKGA